VGLVENSAVNIVAAMLVSPLMVRVSEISVAFYVRNNSSCRTEGCVGEKRNAGRVLVENLKERNRLENFNKLINRLFI
jgi:hypothetical protein